MPRHLGPPWRRIMRLADWPALDRAAWAEALRPGDMFDDDAGPASNWRQDTLDKVMNGYGIWLMFLAATGRLDATADPAARVTPANLGAYVEAMRGAVRQTTIVSRVTDLAAALRVMGPRADRRLLDLTLARLRAEPRDRKPKLHRMVTADRLYRLGCRIMADAPAMADQNYRWPAFYRDGLLIALLAARPLRLRSLVSLTLGDSIVRGDGVWLLRVPADAMKTRRVFEAPLPRSLTAALDRYVAEIRPALLGKHETDAFWVTIRGGAMSRPGVRARVCELTQEHFGESVHPHLFRHCAATSIAVFDPVHVRLAAQLLGHTDLSGVEKHYNMARMVDASRAHGAVLRRLRRDTATAVGRSVRGRQHCRE